MMLSNGLQKSASQFSSVRRVQYFRFSPPGGVATCGAETTRQVEISRRALIKWLCRVSVGLKIHAESSSNGSCKSLDEASVKKKSQRLQKHRNLTRSQYRCCRNRNTKVARVRLLFTTSIVCQSLEKVSKGSQSQDSSRARTRLPHLPLRRKEGQVLAAGQVPPS